MASKARSFILSRYKEVHKKLKIIEVKPDDGFCEVRFEKNYILILNDAEKEILNPVVDENAV